MPDVEAKDGCLRPDARMYELTLKSWKSHGVTSLDGSGVLGRDPVGEADAVASSRLPWCPWRIEPCFDDDVCSRCRVAGILVSELFDDCRP